MEKVDIDSLDEVHDRDELVLVCKELNSNTMEKQSTQSNTMNVTGGTVKNNSRTGNPNCVNSYQATLTLNNGRIEIGASSKVSIESYFLTDKIIVKIIEYWQVHLSLSGLT